MMEHTKSNSGVTVIHVHPEFKEYGATVDGKILSLKRQTTIQLKPANSGNGYHKISVCKDGEVAGALVHRFIYECWRGSIPKGWHVHHRNGDPTDNRLENLQAMPAEEHMKMQPKGEAHRLSKLTRTQVLGMRVLYASGHATIKQMAEWAGVAYDTAYAAITGLSWKHLPTFRMLGS